jgi:phosphoserine phosphatase
LSEQCKLTLDLNKTGGEASAELQAVLHKISQITEDTSGKVRYCSVDFDNTLISYEGDLTPEEQVLKYYLKNNLIGENKPSDEELRSTLLPEEFTTQFTDEQTQNLKSKLEPLIAVWQNATPETFEAFHKQFTDYFNAAMKLNKLALKTKGLENAYFLDDKCVFKGKTPQELKEVTKAAIDSGDIEYNYNQQVEQIIKACKEKSLRVIINTASNNIVVQTLLENEHPDFEVKGTILNTDDDKFTGATSANIFENKVKDLNGEIVVAIGDGIDKDKKPGHDQKMLDAATDVAITIIPPSSLAS